LLVADHLEIDRVFALQQQTVWTLKSSSSEERKQRLIKLRDRLQTAGPDVAEALYQDMGRPKVEMPFDVQNAIDAANEAIEKLDDWMAPTPIETGDAGSSVQTYVHYEARGTILILGPWNFPFHLCFEPLVAAIAAGNSAIIKPASMAPATSAVVAKVVRDVFDESEVAVFEGDSEIATALLDKPFDHIFLTGSPKVGKIVMAAAAKHLTSVTLELGGKNPAIIDRTADLDAAASALVTGRMMNNGQVCLSVDYVLVPDDLSDTFVEKMIRKIKEDYYMAEGFDAARVGRFVDRRNHDRVRGYVDEAVSKGAKLAFGGASNPDALTMEPTVLTNVPEGTTIMDEEIFGPVTVVVSYKTTEDAIRIIQRHGKPLGSVAFSNDEAFVQTFIQNTTSGGVSVNGWAEYYFDGRLPFGGVNGSGIGRYHSIYGFREFSHERAIFSRNVGSMQG
jgi:aldehyde dehydrogenase (NAD+)